MIHLLYFFPIHMKTMLDIWSQALPSGHYKNYNDFIMG